MKLIDLLVKIANNEEVPKEIMCKTHYWKYNKERNDYIDEDNDLVFSCSNYDIVSMLNYEIEIIEEKPKKIEKISVKTNDHNVRKVANKINEIIDYLLEKESDK